MDLIIQLGIIIILAAVFAYIARALKQPLIPAYVVAGIILVATGFIGHNGTVETISTIGIAFLLFIVGLEIDLKKLKDVGLVSTLGGGVLSAILFLAGIFIAGLFGLSFLSGVYIGLVFAFSSTMIVLKLLSDKRELDTLHGRIIIGILLMQDILAIFALFILSSINNFSVPLLIKNIGLLVIILGIAYFSSIYIFPAVFKHAAKSEELLFVVAIGICLAFVVLFHYLGFSIGIGAFLAGVTLANLPYNIEIISRIKPLRDFFAVIFFVALGLQLRIFELNAYLAIAIVLTLLIMFAKPFLTLIIVSTFGYTKKPAFTTSLLLAQVSEFSLILVLFGITAGHISQGLFSAIILIAIITISLTAYLSEYEGWVYARCSKILGCFEKKYRYRTIDYVPKKIKTQVILIGADRLGYNILKTLKNMKKKFIVVDYDPEVTKHLLKKKIPSIYGDIGDLEILNRLNLKEVELIVSTAPDKKDNLLLVKKTKKVNPGAVIIVTSADVDDALELYDAGADYVILPHFLGGERISLLIEEAKGNMKKLIKYKLQHLKELKHRKCIGHRHPKRH